MKRKSLATLLSGLLTVSLTGVGFASWIIVKDAENSVTNGSVTVESVQDRRLTVVPVITDGNVKFGPEQVQTDGWLITTSSIEAQQDLSFTFEVTVGNSDYLKGLSISIENTAYAKAATNGYVTPLPTIPTLTNTTGTVAAGTETNISTYSVSTNYTAGETVENVYTPGTTVFTVTVNLNWGSKFNYKNPYDYFNDNYKTPTDAAVEEANTSLVAVYGLNSQSFTVSVEATAKRD